jgi:uncharacterized protein (TIGR00299 family) protein
MLLGALLGAGVPLATLQAAVDAITPEPVPLRAETVQRAGLAATRCHVEVPDTHHHRSWRDVRALLLAAELDEAVRERALAVFERLAVAEATVHGSDPLDVSFHEVGALDAIADVVGACAGFVALGARVVVSQVGVGSGTVRGAHGVLPVPPPAVAELLRGAPSWAGPPGAPPMELCTPTGAAVLTTLADGWGPQPAMVTDTIGVGAGTRDPHTHANVVRVLAGSETPGAPGGADGEVGTEVVLETNVDDLDPRLWPGVLTALLDAGAADAWLTPILMKKGRPAHTLSVLVPVGALPAVRAVVFRETSSIGLREVAVAKHALQRETAHVQVDGEDVSVKVARLDGEVVNVQPEWDDVARAAAVLGRPVLDVLADAAAASRRLARP